MCGIFAVIQLVSSYNKRQHETQFKELWMSGQSRGPENSSWLDHEVGYIGFHRLAINGLNTISNQPLKKKDCILICNGEIYNYKELYKSLGIEQETNSDCEIIIDMYKKYGIEYTLQNLDGVFGFVLIDDENKQTFVARDPFGVRPIYYNKSIDCLMISSEYKQVQSFCYNGCEYGQFPPGCYLSVLKDKDYITKYSDFIKYNNFQLRLSYNSYETDERLIPYQDIYNNLFAAVKKRVENTDRPVACLLSGGLDSSLIACMVKRILPQNIELETYSIGMPGGADFAHAKTVADFIGSKHTEILVDENDFFNAIPDVIKAISSYDTTTVRASVGNYLIGKYISEHSDAKVIFNGDGSDELAGGYMYFHYCPDSQTFDFECKRLLSNIHHFDGLRSDRCISTHGLETRTPFLDRSFVNYYLSIPAHFRDHNKVGKIEKYLLRKSVELYGENLMPSSVLWRNKEAFSDGVSANDNSWHSIIQKRVGEMKELDSTKKYNYNHPDSLEKLYYRTVFDKFYPSSEKIIPYFWMPQFCNATDASARELTIYKNKNIE